MTTDGAAAGVKPEDVIEVARACNNLCFYLNLHLLAKSRGDRVEIPPEVSVIADLAKKLPMPEQARWALLAQGETAPPKPKGGKGKKTPAAAGAGVGAEDGEGTGTKRKRGTWNEENRVELVKLVDDEAYRTQTLGDSKLNWASLARHLGFTGPTVHRQYNAIKGIEPASAAKAKKAPAAAEGAAAGAVAAGGAAATAVPTAAAVAAAPKEEASPTKKAKTAKKDTTAKAEPAAVQAAPVPAAPVPAAPSPAPAAAAADGWSTAEKELLVILVRDENVRKQVLGKKKLKWQKIAEHFNKDKKAAKRKFTEITGEAVE